MNQLTDCRVVHLFRAPVGGLFRHVCDLAGEQSKLGLEIGIICDSLTGGDSATAALERLSADCSLGVHRVAIDRIPGPGDFGAARKIRQLLTGMRPDILHGHGAKGAAFGRLLARSAGARSVYTPHGGSLHYSRSSVAGFLFLTLEQLLLGRTNGAIFESQYSADVFSDKVGKPRCPSRVIHNGIRDDEFDIEPAAQPDYDFTFIGEIRELKGVLILLEAVRKVAENRRFSIAIIGDGGLKPKVQDLVRAWSLNDVVTLLPPVYPASAAIRNSGCVVIPSLAESLPYIVLETVAAGVPIITTRVGGVPEIFGPFEDALIRPGDSTALADAMIETLDNPDERQALAAGLRNRARQKFSISQMVRSTLDFYQELSLKLPEGPAH